MYRDLAIPPVGRLDLILVDTEIILCKVHCCHYPLGWSVFLQSLILLRLPQCICPVDSQLVKLFLQFLDKAKVHTFLLHKVFSFTQFIFSLLPFSPHYRLVQFLLLFECFTKPWTEYCSTPCRLCVLSAQPLLKVAHTVLSISSSAVLMGCWVVCFSLLIFSTGLTCVTEALSECPALRWHDVSWTPAKKVLLDVFALGYCRTNWSKRQATGFVKTVFCFLSLLLTVWRPGKWTAFFSKKSFCAVLPHLVLATLVGCIKTA